MAALGSRVLTLLVAIATAFLILAIAWWLSHYYRNYTDDLPVWLPTLEVGALVIAFTLIFGGLLVLILGGRIATWGRSSVVLGSLLTAPLYLYLDSPLGELGARFSPPEHFFGAEIMRGAALYFPPNEYREGRPIGLMNDDFFFCHPESGNVIRVPYGFETDFASIPAAARALISPQGRHMEPAIVHDWLYAVGVPGDQEGRLFADRVFLYALEYKGVNWFKRSAMYRAVRWGGGEAYGREGELRMRDPGSLTQPLEFDADQYETFVENLPNCEAFKDRYTYEQTRLLRSFRPSPRSSSANAPPEDQD